MEKYFYVRKKDLAIIHANNYHRLSEHEKKFVCLAWLPSGKVKLHKINNYCICLQPNSSLNLKFKSSPLRDSAVKRALSKKK